MSDTQLIGQRQAAKPRTTSRSHTLAVVVAVVVAVGGVVGIGLVARTGGTTAAAKGSEVQRVRNLDQAQRNALVAGDADTLDEILAADFVMVPRPGEIESRKEYLDWIASGDLDYQAFDPISPVDVRLAGTMAVVTYDSHLEVTSGGFHLQHTARNTHVYEHRNGQWQQVWAQATAVGGSDELSCGSVRRRECPPPGT